MPIWSHFLNNFIKNGTVKSDRFNTFDKRRRMKNFLFILILLFSFKSHAQEGFQLGIEVSPAWHLDVQKNKVTTIRTTASGYGFNVGVPIKWWVSDYLALQTGLTFELMLFDERINKTLLSSNRHGSINLPVMFNYALASNWYLLFGGGINYNVLNKQWTSLGKIELGGITNSFQPYAGLGLSTMVERDVGIFELGAQMRYHFIDLYKPSTFSNGDFVDRVLSFDVLLRYYLFNK
jgi:Outer membrane protein beta-barrel domain